MAGFFVGIVLGALTALVAMVAVMRARMIQVLQSPLGFEETMAALERGVDNAEGWNSPGKRDLNAMMLKHGVNFGPRVALLEMCKAPYASEVLRDDRRMATLMPCALAIYEDDGGKVWVSKMNTGLMGRFFGGTVGRVMGGQVSSEEEIILGELVQPASAVSTSTGAEEKPAGEAARK
jgi:uncharacterized protein (DUF302 family)